MNLDLNLNFEGIMRVPKASSEPFRSFTAPQVLRLLLLYDALK